eukprot:3015879-Heterocapsa_arctica.AAC.1
MVGGQAPRALVAHPSGPRTVARGPVRNARAVLVLRAQAVVLAVGGEQVAVDVVVRAAIPLGLLDASLLSRLVGRLAFACVADRRFAGEQVAKLSLIHISEPTRR